MATSENKVTDLLFQPLQLGLLSLSNRLAVAPMTRVSASEHGVPTAPMADYYKGFAEGGFGLVITEGLYTDERSSQGYLFQPGLANAAQRDAWREIVTGVHDSGARIIAQLMHAGALSQGNAHSSRTLAPSVVRPKGQQMAFYRGQGEYPLPEAMTARDIRDVVEGFVQAAIHARDAGFDGVEIHGANGYLLDQFLTEGINLRGDGYGGSVLNRVRLIEEVVLAVRNALGSGVALGLRISQAKVNDFSHKWLGGEEEAALIFGALGQLPLDYLHTTEYEAWKPAFAEGASLAALARKHSGLPVLANGSLHVAHQAAGMIQRGEADAVTLGRGALTHADWPKRLAQGATLKAFDPAILSPIADLANAARYHAAS
jgi:2,4-dienoyl-CoA reductase-like NADH-dependent reductase (Old Yellow Enzyme family)